MTQISYFTIDDNLQRKILKLYFICHKMNNQIAFKKKECDIYAVTDIDTLKIA